MDKPASPTDSPELALKRAREARARDIYFDNLRATKIPEAAEIRQIKMKPIG
jgi:hypothetical protein